MIKRVLAIVLLYAALPLALNAQRTIHYNYDNAGNRSSRISMRATLVENPGVTVASAAAEENHGLRSGTAFRANQLYDYDFLLFLTVSCAVTLVVCCIWCLACHRETADTIPLVSGLGLCLTPE